LFGICRQLDLQNFVAVMPGSHTKIVRVEENGAKQVFEIPDALAENAAAYGAELLFILRRQQAIE
jgi:hypothetical protein